MLAASKTFVVFLNGVLLLPSQLTLAQTLASPPFFKTSFDCAKVRAFSTEEAICKNEDLAKLDVEMAEAYRKRLDSAATSEKEQLIASQRRWLLIRNAHNVNPYHGDPPGALADLSDFYQQRIAALRSSDPVLLKTETPREYEWLRAIAPEGFSKDEFSISRGYASCEDPCQKKPELYRWISIGGTGLDGGAGDIDTPYSELVKRLAAEGWIKCREATDDSGKLRVDHFSKKDKMATVSRYYSMGVGNSIGLSITTAGPLPQNTPRLVPNPTVTITDYWNVYSRPDVGLKVRFPPGWHVRDATPTNGVGQYKYLTFAADNFEPGEFRIIVEPVGPEDPNYNPPDAPNCFPSRYRISGLPGRECLFENEEASEGTCTRYVHSIAIRTGKYDLTFEPSGVGSFPDESGHYKLTDLYEKIMGTIEIVKPN